jgi:hypothetical protein
MGYEDLEDDSDPSPAVRNSGFQKNKPQSAQRLQRLLCVLCGYFV